MIVQDITLSPQQEIAAAALSQFLADYPNTARPFFVLEGYAGTGKSFCIAELIRRQGLYARYMTYTGKAALVLNKYHNLGCTTIHSAIYRLRQVSDAVFKEMYEKYEEAEEDEKKALGEEIKELEQLNFELNHEAFDEDTPDVIVLDECSMVDSEVLDDLLSFKIPIVALGDPGQLPPVKGTGALFTGPADAMLTDILRQAKESPIIEWSFYARNQRTLPATDFDMWQQDLVSKVPKAMVTNEQLTKMFDHHDQVICWKNVTRCKMNWWRRRSLDYKGIYPNVGETLIITQNDRDHNLVNGQFVEVTEVGELMDNYIELKVAVTDEDREVKLKIMRACFEEYVNPDIWKTVRPWDYRGNQQADYGYTLTCHKAQGSQWPRVLVVEENVFNWHKNNAQARRAEWLYTAITRAMEKVTVIAGR